MKNKHLNIILANSPINNGNRGCVALTVSSVYLIDKILLEKGIDYTLYVLDTNLHDYENYSVDLFDRKIDLLPISYPSSFNLKGWGKLVIKPISLLDSINIFRNSDYVLDIGQGDSFADIYGKNRFRLIDRIHVLARFFNKSYILLPQTIGPFSDEHIKAKAIRSISKSAFVMARDKQSYDYVRKIAPQQENVREYIDIAFFLPFQRKEFVAGKIHVGLNISALLWNGGYTGNNQFGLKCDYQKTVCQIIDYFLSKPDVMLHLTPHVVGSERHVENDYAVSFDLCEKYHNDRLVLAPLFLSPVDAKSYISGLDFFMGARMHATIAAFSSGVPVVPMAYSRKFNGLFHDTLQYNYVVDMKKMTDTETLVSIKNAFGNKEKLKEMIEERLNGMVEERKTKLLEDLSKCLNKYDG